MIDIETAVFDRVRNALREAFLSDYPDLTVLSNRPEVHQKFPCVILKQDDNAAYTKAQTASTEEEFAEVMFTLEVYTSNISGADTLAKKIGDVADRELSKLYFTRSFFREIPNADRKLRRYTGRYRAIVRKYTVNGVDKYLLYRR